MLNMMRLDIFGMKSFWGRICLRALLPFILILAGAPVFFIAWMAYMMQDSAFYTFVTEEKGKLNHLYMTLPVNRKIIVRARFALVLAFLAIGIMLGTVFMLALSALLYGRTIIFEYNFNPGFNKMLLLISSAVLYCGIVNLPTLPLLLKLGYNKGKFIGFYLPSFAMIAIVVLVALLMNNVEAFNESVLSFVAWAHSNVALVSAMIMGAAVMTFAAAYALSQRVYAKREF